MDNKILILLLIVCTVSIAALIAHVIEIHDDLSRMTRLFFLHKLKGKTVGNENSALRRKLGRCKVYCYYGEIQRLEDELRDIPNDWIPDFMKPFPEEPEATDAPA